MTRAPLRLPSLLQAQIEWFAHDLLTTDVPFDFTHPLGEEALVPAASVSWQVFKNPLTLFIGGVTAVLLELAEPRVRHGVWDHSTFRTDPVTRLKRTGLAAMATVYGPRQAAEAMIAGVGRRHNAVRGVTVGGEPYHALDPELLDWVQATASFGFLESYSRFTRQLSVEDRDRYYSEALPAARLYGATGAPATDVERQTLFAHLDGRLEPSPVLEEFLSIMRKAEIFPAALRWLQRLLIRAAITLFPPPLRRRLLPKERELSWIEERLLCRACRLADRIPIAASPAVQSCVRLGLPADMLYR